MLVPSICALVLLLLVPLPPSGVESLPPEPHPLEPPPPHRVLHVFFPAPALAAGGVRRLALGFRTLKFKSQPLQLRQLHKRGNEFLQEAEERYSTVVSLRRPLSRGHLRQESGSSQGRASKSSALWSLCGARCYREAAIFPPTTRPNRTTISSTTFVSQAPRWSHASFGLCFSCCLGLQAWTWQCYALSERTEHGNQSFLSRGWFTNKCISGSSPHPPHR